MKKYFFLLMTLLLLFGFGCKKEATQPTSYTGIPQPPIQKELTTEEQFAKDVHIDVSAQKSDIDIIVFDTIVSPTDGWLVVYDIHNTQPSIAPIGYTKIIQGEHTQVQVTLEHTTALGDKYIAIIHLDDNEIGTFEFPKADPPLPMKGILVEIQ